MKCKKFLLGVSFVISGWVCPAQGECGSDNLILGTPGGDVQVVDRLGYAVGFSEKYKQPLGVTYCLTAMEVTNVVVSRVSGFHIDLAVNNSADPSDYTRSGYDRGHIAPAADMRWSKNAMLESFLMSNCCPQTPGFNRGIWKRLEEWCREEAVKRGSIYIIAGPIFIPDEDNETIGLNKVPVPRYFYKVIFDVKAKKMLAFIFQNRNDHNLVKYTVSVDEVEDATGLDFFSDLPKVEQEKMESEYDPLSWLK